MKVTSRELNLIVALVSVAIIYLLYTFLFSPLIANISIAKENLIAVETQQLQVEENQANLPNIIKQQKDLIIESDKNVEKFIPNLNEDILVTFFAGTVAKGGPGIENLSLDQLAVVDLSTLIAQPYAGLSYPLGDIARQAKGNENNSTAIPAQGVQPGSTVLAQGVSISFGKATYEQVINQIKTVEAMNRTIIVNSMSLSKGEAGVLSGSINYSFYGVDKLTDKDKGLNKTVLTDSNGKANPFN